MAQGKHSRAITWMKSKLESFFWEHQAGTFLWSQVKETRCLVGEKACNHSMGIKRSVQDYSMRSSYFVLCLIACVFNLDLLDLGDISQS